MQKKVVFLLASIFVVFFTIGVAYKVHSHHVVTAIARADKVEANTILPNQTGWMGYATGTVVSPGVTYMGQELASSSYDLYVSLVEHYADSPNFVRETPPEKWCVDVTGGAYDTDGYSHENPNAANVQALDHLSGYADAGIYWERAESITHQGHTGNVNLDFETYDDDQNSQGFSLIKELE